MYKAISFFKLATFLSVLSLMPISSAMAEQCCLAKRGTVKLSAEVVVDGLSRPWGMAFLPDETLLITERRGALRHLKGKQLSKPFSGLPKITATGQGGLLDIALDPDFSQNQQIYFSYSEPDPNRNIYGTAVAKAKIDLRNQRINDVNVIFRANKKSGGGRHFGSRLRFADDKTLFITLGDRGTQPRAQDPFDHAGSVIRINRDGSIPGNNPFADGSKAMPEIWSIGHRNPQGSAIHPETGELWTLSHGAAGGDEINIAKAGKNYGWPQISYGSNYSGRGFAQGSSAGGFEQPVYYWAPSIAPSGLTFYDPVNALIPAWKGSLLAGALGGQHLSRLILKGDNIVGEEQYFLSDFGRIRDVRTGPDGAVWMLTDARNGKLIRVVQK